MDLGAKMKTRVRELAQRSSEAVEAARSPMEKDRELEWIERQWWRLRKEEPREQERRRNAVCRWRGIRQRRQWEIG